jgi:hypothetical protein
MSSNPAASHVHPAGFKLVREVLRSAGLRGSESDASSDMKRDASLFLTAEFRSGARTKSALLNSLANRKRCATVAILDLQSKGSAVARWQDEGGR